MKQIVQSMIAEKKDFVKKITEKRLWEGFLNQQEIASQAALLIQDFQSKLVEDLGAVENLVEEHGFAIIKWLDFSTMSPRERKIFLLGVSKLIWEPTYTDQLRENVIRDIAPRKNLKHQVGTISELSGEAEFHTDSQYIPIPEKFFILACQNPAIQWGDSLLIDSENILKNIKKKSPQCYENMSSYQFLFLVPSSFTKTWDDRSIELLKAPIVSEEVPMRYREDTIRNAQKLVPTFFTAQHEEILEKIKESIEQSEKMQFRLERNDILVVDNHRLLHGRTDFSDSQRLLYRIRMNKKSHA